ncbi:dGTPase [Pseudomonas sp. PDM16]|uniref:dGTPase n=1 Tax=Pseudomonas sp. PDM16 TaxID=2769292 RepID=UPI0017802CB4|nr:dGTPase [Pseudomonas sp. PDM16]MBD9417086.1 dGTPase [Pseudomonas sp. PDM16]
MDFKAKISQRRARENGTVPEPGDAAWLFELGERLESDRGRIVNSAAVRRLQQKTQVFPLERNAAVRSRLTHSLEVQQVGRHIVRTLFHKLGPRAADYGLGGLGRELETLVEMACLTHDIGNPPFGHFGEFAIGDWCARHLDALFTAAVPIPGDTELRQRMLADLMTFEGNAQAIRLVHRLHDMNLTYSQTACMLKYVRAAYQPRPAKGMQNGYLAKKPGFYLSEEGFVAELWQVLGMAPGTRHPLVYVMEAADDISYCLADLEDAVVKRMLDLKRLNELLRETFAEFFPLDCVIDEQGRSFAELLDDARDAAEREPVDKVGKFFIRLRVNLIHPLVQHAAAQFVEHIDAVYAGTLDRALLEDDSPACAVVQTFKTVGARHVYCHPEVETLHLRGLRILQGLLDGYGALLGLSGEAFSAVLDGKGRAGLRMLARRLPTHLLAAYQVAVDGREGKDAALWEFYYRARLLLDFVSGLTDQLAEDEHRVLTAS